MNADLGAGTPERIETIVKDYWSAQEPILASMQPAPDPIKADVEALLALARQGASTGDSATFTSPDLQTADRNIDQYMLRECGYGQISITATDNAYQGIPATITSGAVGDHADQRGPRGAPGVDRPDRRRRRRTVSALLDLPPDQRMQAATALGSVEVDPGGAGTLFLRLVPGRYGLGDFLSQGSAASTRPAAATRTTFSASRASSPSPDPSCPGPVAVGTNRWCRTAGTADSAPAHGATSGSTARPHERGACLVVCGSREARCRACAGADTRPMPAASSTVPASTSAAPVQPPTRSMAALARTITPSGMRSIPATTVTCRRRVRRSTAGVRSPSPVPGATRSPSGVLAAISITTGLRRSGDESPEAGRSRSGRFVLTPRGRVARMAQPLDAVGAAPAVSLRGSTSAVAEAATARRCGHAPIDKAVTTSPAARGRARRAVSARRAGASAARCCRRASRWRVSRCAGGRRGARGPAPDAT